MSYICKPEQSVQLKNLLESDGFQTKMEESLDKSLHRNLFLSNEMCLEAVKLWNRTTYFKSKVCLPKPSSIMSRPVAMICYNTFPAMEEEDQLPDTDCEGLRQALIDLKWKNEDIIMERSWTSDKLKKSIAQTIQDKKSTASMFLLCIASHGNDEKIHAETLTSQPMDNDKGPRQTETNHITINSIIGILAAFSDPSIPKVLIIDCCRVKTDEWDDGNTVVLKENNITLLFSACPGEYSVTDLYLYHLAKEIKKANGITPLSKMHTNAATEVKRERTLVLEENSTVKIGSEITEKLFLKNGEQREFSEGDTLLLQGGNVHVQKADTSGFKLVGVGDFKPKQTPKYSDTGKTIDLRNYSYDEDPVVCGLCKLEKEELVTCSSCLNKYTCSECLLEIALEYFEENDKTTYRFLLNRNSSRALYQLVSNFEQIQLCSQCCSDRTLATTQSEYNVCTE
ncbi:uncharacterized protein [Watersipora subatra]|uniref:uncharacterized protein n=1 Tax=Watersipora subatra TaxID=2589382 RepID=UPI00355BB8AC